MRKVRDVAFLTQSEKRMPGGNEIAQMAQNQLRMRYEAKGLDSSSPSYLRAHCDELLEELLDTEFELYKQLEHETNIGRLWQIIESSLPAGPLTKSQLEGVIKGKFHDLHKFYKSISQSRATRAGGSLQNHIAYFFTILHYPFEAQKEINGKPDFILPNATLYNSNPAECLLVTAKRTLRERWRQIIIEGFRSPQYFLVTIDAKQSSHSIREMAGHRIYLVVPANIIQDNPMYQSAGNIVSFKAFLDNYLDPAMRRWRQAGIIS